MRLSFSNRSNRWFATAALGAVVALAPLVFAGCQTSQRDGPTTILSPDGDFDDPEDFHELHNDLEAPTFQRADTGPIDVP